MRYHLSNLGAPVRKSAYLREFSHFRTRAMRSNPPCFDLSRDHYVTNPDVLILITQDEFPLTLR
jgi:hypothetical protein